MAYGMQIWNDQGGLQFDTTEHMLYQNSSSTYNTTIGFKSQGGGSGNTSGVVYYDSIAVQSTSPTDLIWARPGGGYGAIGLLVYYGSAGTSDDIKRLYAGQTFTTTAAQGSLTFGGTGNIDWFKARNASDHVITTGTGYGLELYDASGTATFAATSSTVSGFLNVVAIADGSTDISGLNAKGYELFSTTSDTEFDNTYVLLNGGNSVRVWRDNLPQSEPTYTEWEIFIKTYHFYDNGVGLGGKVYGMNISYNGLGSGVAVLDNNVTIGSTLGSDKYVAVIT